MTWLEWSHVNCELWLRLSCTQTVCMADAATHARYSLAYTNVSWCRLRISGKCNSSHVTGHSYITAVCVSVRSTRHISVSKMCLLDTLGPSSYACHIGLTTGGGGVLPRSRYRTPGPISVQPWDGSERWFTSVPQILVIGWSLASRFRI